MNFGSNEIFLLLKLIYNPFPYLNVFLSNTLSSTGSIFSSTSSIITVWPSYKASSITYLNIKSVYLTNTAS